MKHEILSAIITFFVLSIGVNCYSQDYDLIVTAKGDSIACHIDSITDTHIYFEMKSQNRWAQTHIGLADVSEYKRDAIFRKDFVFKAGTSIIESPKPDLPASIRDIQKNSVYMGILSINYARMFPAGDRFGISLGGGLYHFDATGVVGELSALVGGVKHYFEFGIMGVYFITSTAHPDEPDEESIDTAASIRAGYRYQGPKGLLFRAAPNLIFADDVFVFPALSIGYSF
jgi:hypothetical protein